MALREDLYAWIAEQDLWQQDLARRLVDRPQLEGEGYDEALLMIKGCFGAADTSESAPEPQAISLDDIASEVIGDAPRLTSLGGLRGVGAVSEDQSLQFQESGLTIIYGQNAAGKTTYVRALKRICRTVDCDAVVRGNVFAEAGEDMASASATVELLALGIVGQLFDGWIV